MTDTRAAIDLLRDLFPDNEVRAGVCIAWDRHTNVIHNIGSFMGRTLAAGFVSDAVMDLFGGDSSYEGYTSSKSKSGEVVGLMGVTQHALLFVDISSQLRPVIAGSYPIGSVDAAFVNDTLAIHFGTDRDTYRLSNALSEIDRGGAAQLVDELTNYQLSLWSPPGSQVVFREGCQGCGEAIVGYVEMRTYEGSDLPDDEMPENLQYVRFGMRCPGCGGVTCYARACAKQSYDFKWWRGLDYGKCRTCGTVGEASQDIVRSRILVGYQSSVS